MNKFFFKPTIYVSHSIRGSKGDKASEKDIRTNCQRASLVGEKLRRCFPDVDFYIPADGDLTLQILTSANKLNMCDVMFADSRILSSCTGYMWDYTGDSKGCKMEYEFAIDEELCRGLNVIIKDNILRMSYSALRKRLSPVIDACINKFRENL